MIGWLFWKESRMVKWIFFFTKWAKNAPKNIFFKQFVTSCLQNKTIFNIEESATGEYNMKSKIFSFNAIITFVLIAFLFGVTEIGFFYISNKVTADCWENLHQIGKNADSRLVFVSRSQMGALINITDLFTSVETFDNPEVVKYIQEVRVGPLQAPVRVYRRNGYYIYEKGSGTNPKVVGLLNKYFSPSPYITPVHEDVFRPGVMVAEQFFPIRHKGEIVGVLAAVIDLHVLPGFFAQSNVNSEGLNLLILDRRDSLLFVDTFHKKMSKISDYSSRRTKSGYSYEKWVSDVMGKRTSDFAFLRENGEVTFLTALPSLVENWTMLVAISEDVALAKALLVRKTFIIISLIELFALIFYLFWMVRDIKKRLESENREYADILSTLSGSFDDLFYVNLKDDSFIEFVSHKKFQKLEMKTGKENFFTWAKSKIQEYCNFEDQELVLDFLTKSRFADGLNPGESLSVEFRLDDQHRKNRYYRLRAHKAVSAHDHVIFTLENVDDEVRKSDMQRQDLERRNRMIASLAADFDCVQYVELHDAKFDDMAETYRESEMLARIIPGWAAEKTFMLKLDLLLTYVVCDADREDFLAQTRREVILANLKKQPTYYVNFKALINGKELFYQLKFIADRVGTEKIKGFVIGIHSVDEEIKQQLEIQEKLKRNLEIIDILSEDYTALYYMNFKTLKTGVLSLVNDDNTDVRDFISQNDNLMDVFKNFVEELVHPSDRSLLEPYMDLEYVRKTLANQKRINVDFRRNYSGVFKYTRMTIAKAEAVDEEPELVAVGFIEIDEQYRAEAERQENIRRVMTLSDEFESIYDVNIDDGTYRVSTKSSKHSEEIKGYQAMNLDFFELNANSIPVVIYEDDREMMSKYMTKQYMLDRLEKEMSYFIDYRAVIDEKILWYRMKVTRSGNWMNERRMLVGVFNNDENYRKEKAQQEALEQALQMAKSASRAKTTFLNNMSHDIRTPMNAIIGYTRLAKAHLDNSDQIKDYLGKIAQSSDHLLSLINDVLDMSRIESGKMNLNEKSENLSNIIHMLKDIVQADIRSRRIEFFVDSADVSDEEVVCDKLRLNQVLLNVLSNAIKYTPAGGTVSMRIMQLGVTDTGYGKYEFRVKDSGIGMNAEFLKTIYDPFTRVTSSTVSGIQGTGLGMAITKNIVTMMGGEIQIQSEENVGTEVIITFDFKLGCQHKEPERIPEVEGMRCLVVDDDTNACRSIVKMLKDIGMHSEWCASGKEAVIRAEDSFQDNDLFGLFLIDWLMPDVNGIEVARRIRRMVGDEVPILILTAYDWSDIEEEAKNAGVSGFVSKPLFFSDLRKIVSTYCCPHEEVPVKQEPEVSFVGKSILLVEDNELNCEISREVLEDFGIKVSMAEDGSVALNMMKKAKPGDYDLILMDVQMPIMDGFEATRKIRALPDKRIAEIPIIAMTANAFAEDCQAALDAGMNEHVTKPVDFDKLKVTLAKFLT